MDLIGLSGLIVSVAGFALSLWQLRKTRRAAEAAMHAAKETVQAVRVIYSIASIQDICGRSRDLLHLARARNLTSAATAAFELRDLTARFHATEAGKALATVKLWADTLEDLRSLHERFESAAMTNRLDPHERETLVHTISRLHTLFSSFAASAADSGVNHGNS